MSNLKQSRMRRWRGGWREWRRARNQRWVEKQAAKRPGDVYHDAPTGYTGSNTVWRDRP